MQDFLTFISSMLSTLSSFLMSEPAIYFVGIFLLGACCVVVAYAFGFAFWSVGASVTYR